MRNYILRRILLMIPVLILVTFGAFALLRAIPGSVVDLKTGPSVSDEDKQRLTEELGLDKPAYQQYLIWLGDLSRGDLGESLWTRQSVAEELGNRFPPTLLLGTMSAIIAVVIAIPAGTLAALKQDGPVDRGLQVFSALGLAVPNFVLATLVISLPAVWWGWVPPIGYVPFTENPFESIRTFLIPAAIGGLAQAAILTRLTRSAMLEVLRQDYVRTAWAKGLASRVIHRRHTLRNALLPVLTVFGLQISVLLGGTVIMETIFVIPGMGTGFLQSIQFRDYPLAQMLILVIGTIYLFVTLVVDVLYGVIDPRIRYS